MLRLVHPLPLCGVPLKGKQDSAALTLATPLRGGTMDAGYYSQLVIMTGGLLRFNQKRRPFHCKGAHRYGRR